MHGIRHVHSSACLIACLGIGVICRICDSCTKWPEAKPLKTKEATEVETFVLNDVLCRFSVKEIVTDNGPEFAGDFGAMLKWESVGIRHVQDLFAGKWSC